MFHFRAAGQEIRSNSKLKRGIRNQAIRPACEAVEPRMYLTTTFGASTSIAVAGATAPIFAANLGGDQPKSLVIATPTAVQIYNASSSGALAMSASIPLPAGAASETPFVVGNFSGGGPNIVLLSQDPISQNGVVTNVTGGSGSFTTGATSSITDGGVGFKPLFAATGDFNGDGKDDLAVLGQAPGISALVLAILTSNGDGTFIEVHDYSVSSSSSNSSIADETIVTGNLGNGHVGIIVNDTAGVSIDVFSGNGDGSFNVLGGTILVASSLVGGNFTTSGNLDLAAANGNQLTIMLGNGDGTFASQPAISLTQSITALATADIDGDGKLDIVTNQGVLLGNGDGTFQSLIPFPTTLSGGSGFVDNILATDVNGDGKPDIVGFDPAAGAIDTMLNMSPGSTTVTLTSTTGPTASLGSDEQFIANLTSLTSGTPTGTVSFFDGATELGSTTVVGGQAVFDAGSGLALGMHTITAMYGGDSTFQANTSAPFVLTVLPASMTTLTSNDNPALPGANITFTANVTAGTSAPTGTVQFLDGGTLLGTVTLDGTGTAVFMTSTLSTATHQITATYGGDSVLGPSSATVTEVVNRPTLVPVVIASTIPKAVVGGTKVHGNATIALTNKTSGTIAGPVTINLFATSNGTVVSAAMLTTFHSKHLSVKAGKTLKVRLTIKALPALGAGKFTLLATAIDPNGNPSSGTTGPSVAVAAPFIQLSAAKVSVVKPPVIVPGKKGTVSLVIANGGNVPTSGLATIVIGLSTDGQTLAGSLATQNSKLVIKPGKSKKLALHFVIPAGQTAGAFFPYVSFTQNGSTTTAIGTTTFSVG